MTLSDQNRATLERVFAFRPPLPAQFNMGREAVNDLMEAVRAESSLRVEELEASRDEAVRLMSQYAREAGETKGKLETSELAGIVEGWIERASAAEAKLKTAIVALEDIAQRGGALRAREALRSIREGGGDNGSLGANAPPPFAQPETERDG